MFHVGTGRGETVTDALSKWRMGTGEVSDGALFSGALTPLTRPYQDPPTARERGRKEALKALEEQGAVVAAALIGQQCLLLWDPACGQYTSIYVGDCRAVDYASDCNRGRQASLLVGGRRVQILLKEGEEVRFVMCSDYLQEIFCIMARNGLALVISEDVLEQVAHTAAAGPRSKTIVFNVTVPDSLCSALSRFACEVLEVQAAADDLSPYEIQRSCTIAHNQSRLRCLEIQMPTAQVTVRTTRAPRNDRQLPRHAHVLTARSTRAQRSARLQLLHGASVPPAKSTRGHALLPETTHGQAQQPNEPRCGGGYGPSARLAGGRNTRGLSRASDQPCSAMIRHLSGMMPGLAVTSTHRDGSTWPIFDGIRPILTGTYRDGNRLRDPLCIQSSCLALLRNSQRIDGARGCIATQMSKLSRKLAAPFPVSARMRWRLAGPDGTLLCPEDRWHKCTYG